MTLLGELYSNGLGVAQNDLKAAEWYKLAADRGDREAMFALAMLRPRRPRRAARPRGQRQAAGFGRKARPRARRLRSALLYMEGQLFPRDFGHAAELLRDRGASRQSAGPIRARHALQGRPRRAQGHARGGAVVGLASLANDTDDQVEYAIALYNGDGTDRNTQAAAALFLKAAKRNSPIAQNRLAHILASGNGLPADPAGAAKWHLISKAQGETDLVLDDYVGKLDAKTRETGEKAAKAWIDTLKKPPA